jgi:serine/threonine protein kinase
VHWLDLRNSAPAGASVIEVEGRAVAPRLRAAPAGQPQIDLGAPFGRVRVEAELGAGAFGRVLAVRGAGVPGAAALKVIDLTKQTRQQVLREAHLQRDCASPHVIAAQPPAFTARRGYILMELGLRQSVEGALRSLQHGGRRLPVAVVLRWFFAMVRAVHSCHARSVVHRDLKPDNFVLTGRGKMFERVPKLTDFGLATREPWTDAEPVGTVTHLAPELLDRAPASIASDAWGLGVNLYRMLVGIEPYYDDSPALIERRLAWKMPQFTLDDLDAYMVTQGAAPALRTQVCDLVRALLAFDPAERPTPAALLDHDLASA